MCSDSLPFMSMGTKTLLRQNGIAIRALRQKEGLTVDELARQIDVTAPHLRNIENELRSASETHLARIARVLDVPLAAIRNRVADAA